MHGIFQVFSDLITDSAQSSFFVQSMFILVKSNSTSFFFCLQDWEVQVRCMLLSRFMENISSHIVKVEMFVSGNTLQRIGILPKQKDLVFWVFCPTMQQFESKSLSPYLGEDFIQRLSISSPRLFLHHTRISFRDGAKDFYNMAKQGASWFGSNYCSPTILNQRSYWEEIAWECLILSCGVK